MYKNHGENPFSRIWKNDFLAGSLSEKHFPFSQADVSIITHDSGPKCDRSALRSNLGQHILVTKSVQRCAL